MSRWRLLVFVVVLALGCAKPVLAAEVRRATWHVEWFFDHDPSNNPSTIGRDHAAPSAALFAARVTACADAIASLRPTILALQDIGGFCLSPKKGYSTVPGGIAFVPERTASL